MHVEPATPNARGVDCITSLTPAPAAHLKAAGVSFVVRYLGALTIAERDAILGAGLALLAVGYSRRAGWLPTGALGASDGAAAVAHAQSAGLPAGMTLFCDLEGPGAAASAADCIAYVNAWAEAVEAAGYMPGLYVGFGLPLTPEQLWELRVVRYWRSGSQTPEVAHRGFCMRQDPHFDQWVGGVQVDTDVIEMDMRGDVPAWLVAGDAPQAA